MKLSSHVRFFDEPLKQAFQRLKDGSSEEKELYRWLEQAFRDIERNAFCGIQIPKKQIPKQFVKRYKIRNLWKYNLPTAWRLLYSIENQEFAVVSIVLEWGTHKEYAKRLRYA